MRARGSASKDGASGCRVQHKTHDVEALQRISAKTNAIKIGKISVVLLPLFAVV
jgi:hypothetical protein